MYEIGDLIVHIHDNRVLTVHRICQYESLMVDMGGFIERLFYDYIRHANSLDVMRDIVCGR